MKSPEQIASEIPTALKDAGLTFGICASSRAKTSWLAINTSKAVSITAINGDALDDLRRTSFNKYYATRRSHL